MYGIVQEGVRQKKRSKKDAKDKRQSNRHRKDFRNDNHNEGCQNVATKVASGKIKKIDTELYQNTFHLLHLLIICSMINVLLNHRILS